MICYTEAQSFCHTHEYFGRYCSKYDFFGPLGFQAAYLMVRGNNYAHLKLLFSILDWTQTCIWVSVESCEL